MNTVMLGNVKFVDCESVMVVNGVEVFRQRERDGDDQLVVDWELRDETNQLIAKIAKNNAVYCQPGLKQIHEPKMSAVIDPKTGRTWAKAEELSLGLVRVSGTFIFNGFVLEVSETEGILRPFRMNGGGFEKCSKAI